MNKLYIEIVNYIENNKVKNNIEYEESIDTIYELLSEIKSEYKGVINNDL